MPPKANHPDERPSRLKLPFISDKHKRASSIDPAPSRPETPSDQGGTKFNTGKALRITNKVLDALKIVGDASPLLGPLKTTCDALKIVVTAAEGMVKNQEDLKELPAKLRRHLTFIQDKTDTLTDARFRPSGKAIDRLVQSLETYTTALDSLQDKLESLKPKDKTRIRNFLHKMTSVDSDRKELDSCTRQLDESFRLFMDSVTFFVADQTAELYALQTLNQLSYVKNSQGTQHSSCLQGTRQAILQEIAEWAADRDGKPVFCLIDQAGTGKSTISAHLARQWEDECALVSRFFFSKPMGITSAEDAVSTLARAMAERIPLLRSSVVKALEGHKMSESSMDEKLEILVFSPLRQLKEERVKAMSMVRMEMEEKAGMEPGSLESVHECIRSRPEIDNLKNAYTEALKATEKDGHDHRRSVTLEVAYTAYLRALEKALTTPLVIALDALDECTDNDRLKLFPAFLKFIASFSEEPCGFKLFLTSRPEKDIMPIVDESQLIQRMQSSLHLQSNATNQADITIYTTSRLENILNKEEISQIVVRADGLFIWASTAADFIANANDQSKIFHELMESTLSDQPLDSLYSTILDDATKRIGRNEQTQFVNIMKLICVAREPLTTASMDALLNLSSRSGESISGRFIAHLTSVLSDGCDGRAVQALHPTFIEFLPRWQYQYQTVITINNAESLLAQGCLAILLSDKLKYDILDIIRPDAFPPMNKEIDGLEQRMQTKVTSGLCYAATHALSHVAICYWEEVIMTLLQQFFERKLLFWIELMSYLGKIYPLTQSVHVLSRRMNGMMASQSSSLSYELREWCEEIKKMIRPFQAVIEESALEAYSSALAFVPSSSRISQHHHKVFKDKIPKVICGAWSLNSQSIVMSGHQGSVGCVVFSPDGHRIASGSRDNTIRLWDGDTGAAVGEPLRGHTSSVRCLAFSPDGHRIASGSIDNTIRLWDGDTGVAVGESLRGHTDDVWCLAFSPDGRRIASGSGDNTIRLWDAETGVAVGEPLRGYTDSVYCLAFSPDGHRIASGSGDKTIRLWDGETGVAVDEPLRGHTDSVYCLAFSPDGRRIASGSSDYTIRLWDGETGAAVGEPLRGHTKYVWCLSFSPDGRQIASGSGDYTIRLWDAEIGGLVGEPIQFQNFPKSITLHTQDDTLFAVVNYRIVYNLSTIPFKLCHIEGIPSSAVTDHQIQYDQPWTLIRSRFHVRFRLPSNFRIREYKIYHGKVAYGTEDGYVIIIDCTHLL